MKREETSRFVIGENDRGIEKLWPVSGPQRVGQVMNEGDIKVRRNKKFKAATETVQNFVPWRL